MWVALTGNRSTKELMEYTKDRLKDAFTTVPGVGEVFLGGYVEPNLRVWLDKDKMRALRIGDIGTVEDGLDDIRRISRSQGKPAVGTGIRKQRGSNP